MEFYRWIRKSTEFMMNNRDRVSRDKINWKHSTEYGIRNYQKYVFANTSLWIRELFQQTSNARKNLQVNSVTPLTRNMDEAIYRLFVDQSRILWEHNTKWVTTQLKICAMNKMQTKWLQMEMSFLFYLPKYLLTVSQLPLINRIYRRSEFSTLFYSLHAWKNYTKFGIISARCGAPAAYFFIQSQMK